MCSITFSIANKLFTILISNISSINYYSLKYFFNFFIF
nr:MAG TPA: hypothetical protein [Caudoviricetes sp.]